MAGFYQGLPNATLPLTGNEVAAFDTLLTGGANPQTELISVSQLASTVGGNVPQQPSRFYGVPTGATQGAVLTVASTLYAYPVTLVGNTPIKTISNYVTTGQTGGGSHIGIYADNGSGYPGALVNGSDSGALAATASTTAETATYATPVTLAPGLYWLASIFTATGTYPSVNGITETAATSTNDLGFDTLAHAYATSGAWVTGISVANTYGALPAVFPTGAALIVDASTPTVYLGT